jgi:hypothetical protein
MFDKIKEKLFGPSEEHKLKLRQWAQEAAANGNRRERRVITRVSAASLNNKEHNVEKLVHFRQSIYHDLCYYRDSNLVTIQPKNKDSALKGTSFNVEDFSAFIKIVEHQKQMDDALHQLKTIVDEVSSKELFERA